MRDSTLTASRPTTEREYVPGKRLQRQRHAWFALVDGRLGRLVRCERTALGTHRVRELKVLENEWPKHPTSHRVVPGGPVGHTYAVPPNHVAELLRRFAFEFVTWLKAECTERRIETLVIIAAPRLLGQLRKLPDMPNGRFELRQGDLTQLSTAALTVHPLIRSLLDELGTNGHTSQPRSREGNERTRSGRD